MSEHAIPDPDRLVAIPRAAEQATAHIRERYPSASLALIDRCIANAVQHYQDARVENFLPVLLERWAADAIETAASGQAGQTRTTQRR